MLRDCGVRGEASPGFRGSGRAPLAPGLEARCRLAPRLRDSGKRAPPGSRAAAPGRGFALRAVARTHATGRRGPGRAATPARRCRLLCRRLRHARPGSGACWDRARGRHLRLPAAATAAAHLLTRPGEGPGCEFTAAAPPPARPPRDRVHTRAPRLEPARPPSRCPVPGTCRPPLGASSPPRRPSRLAPRAVKGPTARPHWESLTSVKQRQPYRGVGLRLMDESLRRPAPDTHRRLVKVDVAHGAGRRHWIASRGWPSPLLRWAGSEYPGTLPILPQHQAASARRPTQPVRPPSRGDEHGPDYPRILVFESLSMARDYVAKGNGTAVPLSCTSLRARTLRNRKQGIKAHS